MRALLVSIFRSDVLLGLARPVVTTAGPPELWVAAHFEIVDVRDWNLREGRKGVGARSDICSLPESVHMRLAMVAAESVRYMTFLYAFLHPVHHQTKKPDRDTASEETDPRTAGVKNDKRKNSNYR